MLPKRAVHLIAPNVAHRTRAAVGQVAKTGEARSSQERCVRLEEAVSGLVAGGECATRDSWARCHCT